MAWQWDPQTVLCASAVVPVMVIEQLEQALPMAQALLAGGISVFEVTLRTPAALPAITAIRAAFPQALVGAGTVLSALHYEAAQAAGAQFAISPGSTPTLLQHAHSGAIPLIPGVATHRRSCWRWSWVTAISNSSPPRPVVVSPLSKPWPRRSLAPDFVPPVA